jgi:hypothetical protein
MAHNVMSPQSGGQGCPEGHCIEHTATETQPRGRVFQIGTTSHYTAGRCSGKIFKESVVCERTKDTLSHFQLKALRTFLETRIHQNLLRLGPRNIPSESGTCLLNLRFGFRFYLFISHFFRINNYSK